MEFFEPKGNSMKRYFEFDRFRTTYRAEIVAGITTFLTMAYIIIVNPAILEAAGIPKGASTTATILSAAFGTFLMGVLARRPFAIAPYMGENAFIAFTVVKVLGYSWQVALGAIFISGIIFTILTLIGVRGLLAQSIPPSLKFSFAVGIGLFLTFIGLNEVGIVALGVPGAPVSLGNLSHASTLLAIAGFILMAVLSIRRVPGALIIGILVVTAASILLGITPLPAAVVSLPPSLSPIFAQLDIAGALSFKMLPVVLIIFIMAFVDTIGTLIGLSSRAGFLDARGNLPDIERPMLVDALANIAAPVFGTTTSGAYIESASGIEEGGRTGFVSVVVAALFLLALFFTPILTITPAHAYGPVLILIGCFMLKPVTELDFNDLTELIPAFVTITLIAFSYNIGVGMTAGLITYPLIKLLTGRAKEVPPGLWVLAALSAVFYVVYPYR
jgi:AGZA family xanthine/uracil permease-like MFS transporter